MSVFTRKQEEKTGKKWAASIDNCLDLLNTLIVIVLTLFWLFALPITSLFGLGCCAIYRAVTTVVEGGGRLA